MRFIAKIFKNRIILVVALALGGHSISNFGDSIRSVESARNVLYQHNKAAAKLSAAAAHDSFISIFAWADLKKLSKYFAKQRQKKQSPSAHTFPYLLEETLAIYQEDSDVLLSYSERFFESPHLARIENPPKT